MSCQVLCNCGVRELAKVLTSGTWAGVVDEEQYALRDMVVACVGRGV